jgi:hypothetical protein
MRNPGGALVFIDILQYEAMRRRKTEWRIAQVV